MPLNVVSARHCHSTRTGDCLLPNSSGTGDNLIIHGGNINDWEAEAKFDILCGIGNRLTNGEWKREELHRLPRISCRGCCRPSRSGRRSTTAAGSRAATASRWRRPARRAASTTTAGSAARCTAPPAPRTPGPVNTNHKLLIVHCKLLKNLLIVQKL